MPSTPTQEPKVETAEERLAAFSEAFRQRRAELELPQGSIARQIGVRQQTVSRWENGEALPRPRTIRNIATVLGLNPGDLLVKAGYIDPDYRKGGSGKTLDRIAVKFGMLSKHDQQAVERMIDAMRE